MEIKERRENDEHIYELIVDGEIVCTARTLSYSLLLNIHSKVKRRGYGRKLLQYIEEVVRQQGAKTMNIDDIDSKKEEAVSFFKRMGYTLKPIEGNEQFLEGSKNL